MALTALLLLSGCAVGPDFKPSSPPDVTGYTPAPLPDHTASADVPDGGPQQFVSDLDIPGQWWTLFHSEPLNRMIEQALKANPSLVAAQASLRQAHENTLAQVGSYFPSVDAQFSANRNLTATGAVSPASASGSPYYSLITPQLNVAFTPDVFGANRRAVESLEAQEAVQRYQLEATYLTLTSNVVAAAVQEASLRGQIAATQETISADAASLRILQRQLALGQIAGEDVLTQETALAQAQQSLPPLQKQLAQQRDQLAALIGAFPSQEPAGMFELGGLALPLDLPVTLPAKMIAHRPDVRAAEETLHAASAQIGVAVAARLPQITLTGTIGNSANQFSQLFTPGTNFWTIGAGVTQPIFAGGMLLHRQRAAQAAFDQAAAQYRSTVLTAMQNVADALRALQSDADALVAAVRAEHAAAQSLAITRRQLELGQVAYLNLLTAEQAYQQTRLALVQAQAGRLADTAALFQALGGGWWNRHDVATAEGG